MIKTIIVDDEERSQDALHKLLERFCPEVEIVGRANNVASAVEAINSLEPQLVFLDISMPDGDGFEVLEKVKNKNFEVIFTTGHNDYALKAIQFAALHYLLKPINYIELQNAVKRFTLNQKEVGFNEKIEILYDSLNNHHQKIILPITNGLRVIELNQILRCEANGSYTNFYLTNNSMVIVSKILSNFEEILPPDLFCRVHSKHLVNLNYVSQYIKGRGGRVILSNGKEVEVSASKKKEFLTRLKNLAHSLSGCKR